jgi:hypothetical protein
MTHAPGAHGELILVRETPAAGGLYLVAGTVLALAVAVLNVPDNPLLELRRHQLAGTVLAHAAFGLLALGLWPHLLAAMPRLTGRRLAVVVLAAGAAMTGLSFAAPRYGHQILTREWGLVEPAQFALYLVLAGLAFRFARAREERARRLYRLVGVGGIAMALEEVDYLGVVALVAKLGGASRGRIDGKHVGAFHDFPSVLWDRGLLLPVAAVVVAVVAILLIRMSPGLRVVWRESAPRLPLVAGAVLMALAQVKDIDDDRFLLPLVYQGPQVASLLEEPIELLGSLCLAGWLLWKLKLAGAPPARGV